MNLQVECCPNQILTKMFKYFLASFLSLAIDMLIFLMMGKILHNYLISACIGYTVGLFVNYYLSIKWVFSYRKIKKYHIEFGIFTVIGFGGLVVNEVVIYAGLFVMAVTPFLSKLLASGFSFLFNYSIRKLVLF